MKKRNISGVSPVETLIWIKMSAAATNCCEYKSINLQYLEPNEEVEEFKRISRQVGIVACESEC